MKKPSRTLIATVVLIAAAGGGVGAYRHFSTGSSVPQYRMQAVERGEVRQVVSANGTINPVTLVSVGTQVSGTVRKLYVDYNSKVSKGQLLLELDDSLIAAQEKQDSANVKSALASLELATANEKRVRSLFEQAYASRQDLDAAVQGLKAAEAQVQLTRAAVEKDRANLSYTVIRSPVDGVVVDRSVDVGQTVAASLQAPTLFKIAQDLSKMQIDANFAEADIGNIRVGQKVHFTVDAFSGREFRGEVRQIRLSPTIQSNVVTYDVVVNVDNPEQILMPGMTAYVSIAVEERKDALLVPNAALRYKPANAPQMRQGKETGGEKAARPKPGMFAGTVYALRGGALTPVRVTLGITDNRNTEIVDGDLKPGEQVVVGDMQESKAQSSSSARPPMRLF